MFQVLAGSVQPFTFNRLDQLEQIVAEYDLAAVKMEVQRSTPPDPGFLEGVRDLCTRRNIVLIFDECTSGFEKHLEDFISNMELTLILRCLVRLWEMDMLLLPLSAEGM